MKRSDSVDKFLVLSWRFTSERDIPNPVILFIPCIVNCFTNSISTNKSTLYIKVITNKICNASINTCTNICTGLFEMIVGLLTTCHTQYTWDRGIYVFLFNRTTLQVFVTFLTDALYLHPLWFYKHQHDNRVRSVFVACQRWWFQWRFWFIPSVPGYLREEEEHNPDHWHNL